MTLTELEGAVFQISTDPTEKYRILHPKIQMLVMHLSIECPTPYTPDRVRQMWVIAQ